MRKWTCQCGCGNTMTLSSTGWLRIWHSGAGGARARLGSPRITVLLRESKARVSIKLARPTWYESSDISVSPEVAHWLNRRIERALLEKAREGVSS